MAELIDLMKTGRPLEDKPYLHARLERCVAKIQGIFAEDMAGYVVLAVARDGSWSSGWAVDPDEKNPIGRRMLGGLAVEGIRERLVTEAAIEDMLYGEP